MAREIPADHEARGLRFCLVAATFNQTIVRGLVDGALQALRARGAEDDDLEVHWVPGSFELPLAARWAAESGRFAAVVALGVVIRGETEHFRLIADASAQGLLRVMLDTGVPVTDGVLAAENAAHAEARAGGAVGNRGADAALAAVQMANLRRKVGGR